MIGAQALQMRNGGNGMAASGLELPVAAVTDVSNLALDFRAEAVGRSLILQADCFDWLARIPENSLHAVVTDPPYGVKEYDADQIDKRENGNGGIWRIPPSFDRRRQQGSDTLRIAPAERPSRWRRVAAQLTNQGCIGLRRCQAGP